MKRRVENLFHKLDVKTAFFSDLYTIAKEAEAKVTLFAGRRFEVKGYKGNDSIDHLTVVMARIFRQNIHFDENERKNGRKLVARIKALYDDADNKLKESSYFTQLVALIFSLFEQAWPYNRRFRWEEDESRIFEYYTAQQWVQAFPGRPLTVDAYPLLCHLESNETVYRPPEQL